MIQRSPTDADDRDQHRHGRVGRTGPACPQRPLLQAHLCSSPQWPSTRTVPSPPVLGSEGRSSESVETDRKMPSRLCRTNGTRHSGPQQGFLDSECDKPPALPRHTAAGQPTSSAQATEEQAIPSSLQGRCPQSSESPQGPRLRVCLLHADHEKDYHQDSRLALSNY